MIRFLMALSLALLPLAAAGPTTLDLAGTWSLHKPGDEAGAVPISVPGDTHSALLAAGKIPDPYYGINEKEVQWVGEQDWYQLAINN